MKFTHLLIIISAFFYLLIGCSSNKDIKNEDRVTDREILDTGDIQFNAGQYQEAIKSYKSLILNYPTSDLHINAQLKIAGAYGKLEEYEAQMDALHTLLKENIIPQEVPQIYVQIGNFYEQAAHFNPGTITSDTSDYQAAIKFYKKAYTYKDSDDNHSKAAGAYRLALVEAKIGEINNAISHYKAVQTYFPQTDFSVLAEIKLKNPGDTSELPADAESIEAYRQEMNLPEITKPEPTEPEPVIQEETVESVDVADSVFETSPEDSAAGDVDFQNVEADTSGVQ